MGRDEWLTHGLTFKEVGFCRAGLGRCEDTIYFMTVLLLLHVDCGLAVLLLGGSALDHSCSKSRTD